MKVGKSKKEYIDLFLGENCFFVTSYQERAPSEQEFSLLDHFIVRKNRPALNRSLEMGTANLVVTTLRKHATQ